MICLVFNEDYSASRGRLDAAGGFVKTRLRLGRILAELAPAEPEVHGLVALMEIQAIADGGRRWDRQESPILLLEQNRSPLGSVARSAAVSPRLERAGTLGGARGPYTLGRRSPPATHELAPRRRPTGSGSRLYASSLCYSFTRRGAKPRAVAVAMAVGARGLELVDAAQSEPS